MYTIYINDRPLRLLSSSEPGTRGSAPAHTHLTARYNGKPRTLLNYVDMLEKGSPKVMCVDMVTSDLPGLWRDFRSHFKWVPAAGGVVRHADDGACLVIYRRGFYDLPKGKIDAGEDEPTAALREVKEETGVGGLTIHRQLPTTFHTYRTRKGKRILKPTYWFLMRTDVRPLTPETEEDIEWAKWLTEEELAPRLDKFYASLRGLIKNGIAPI